MAWYDAFPDSVKSQVATETSHSLEVFLQQDPTLSDEAKTAMQDASLVFTVLVSYQDVNNDDATDVVNMTSVTVQETVPYSQMTSLAAPGYTELRYANIDLLDHVIDGAPSNPNPNYTRTIKGKGLLNVQATNVASTFAFADGVVGNLPASTNCLPDKLEEYRAVCLGATAYITDQQSESVPCVGGFPGTTCAKMYHIGPPARELFTLKEVDSYRVEGGVWVADNTNNPTLYLQSYGHTGVPILNASPCFPNPTCPKSKLFSIQPAFSTGTLVIILAVILLIFCVATFFLFVRRRKPRSVARTVTS